MPIRIAYFGSSEFSAAVLKHLLRSQCCEIVQVISQPDAPVGRKHILTPPPVARFATESGLPLWQPKSLKRDSALQRFTELQAEAGVVVAYGKIIPQAMLTAVPYGFINGHASDLPRFRGAAPIHRAILARDSSTAMCIMAMTQNLDDGDILLREGLPIAADEGFLSLEKRLLDSCCRLLSTALGDLSRVLQGRQAQNTVGITYADKIHPDEAWFEPQSDDIHSAMAKVLAFEDSSGLVIQLAGKRISVLSARKEICTSATSFGVVHTVNRREFSLALQGGYLWPLTLKPAGKGTMTAQSFLAGNRLISGDKVQGRED